MNYRQWLILPAKTFSADGVETQDLNIADPISALDLLYRITNGSGTPTEHPTKVITKIEILDGSTVIASLSGWQAQALHYWHWGEWPFHTTNYQNGTQSIVHFSIPFGRWLWDETLALDPKRFRNLQVRVTVDYDAGGASPSSGTLELVAHVFDEKKINPIGFLRNLQWYTYALTSGAYETIDLPRDDIIKLLMVQSRFPTKAINSQLSELRLAENGEAKIAFDQGVADLMRYITKGKHPITEEWRGGLTTTATAYYFAAALNEQIYGTPMDTTPDYLCATPLYGGKFNLDAYASGAYMGHVTGWCPHGSIGLDFGDPWIIEDWFDPRRLTDLKLRIKAGSSVGSSSTAEVVLQSLKKY